MEIYKIYGHNNKTYYIKLRQLENKDLVLEVKYQGELLKSYNVIEDYKHYCKVDGSQIRCNNIYQLVADMEGEGKSTGGDYLAKVLIERDIE